MRKLTMIIAVVFMSILLISCPAMAEDAVNLSNDSLADDQENDIPEYRSSEAETEIAYAEAFPSWNSGSASLGELVAFVSACTDESSPDYLEAADRIAVFDMDGAILCEKAPVYVDYCLTMYRVLDDPTYEATEEEIDAMQQIRDHAYSEGETFDPEGLAQTTGKKKIFRSFGNGMMAICLAISRSIIPGL